MNHFGIQLSTLVKSLSAFCLKRAVSHHHQQLSRQAFCPSPRAILSAPGPLKLALRTIRREGHLLSRKQRPPAAAAPRPAAAAAAFSSIVVLKLLAVSRKALLCESAGASLSHPKQGKTAAFVRRRGGNSGGEKNEVTETALLRLIRSHVVQIVLLCLFALAIVGMNSLVPLVLGRLYDLKSHPPAADCLHWKYLDLLIPWKQLAVAIGILSLTSICRSVVNYCVNVTTNRIELNLRQRLFEAFVLKDMEFFDRNQTSVLVEQLLNDVHAVTLLFSQLVESVKSMGKIVVGLSYILYVSPEIFFATTVMVPVGVALALTTFHQLVKTQHERQRAEAQLKGYMNETLSGIRTVRAFAAEQEEYQKHSDLVAELHSSGKQAYFASCLHSGNFHLMNSFAISVWLALGAALAWNEKITGGQVNSIVQYSKAAGEGLASIADQHHIFLRGGLAASRIYQFLDEVSFIEQCAGRECDLKGSVTLKDVTFSYPTRRNVTVLDGVTITIEAGKTSALVGSSGSGKSTISDLLLRFYDPESGHVRVGEVDLKDISTKELRKRIAIVQQEPFLFSGTIEENIRYGKVDATAAEVENAAKLAAAHEFISLFPKGYQTSLGYGAKNLSGGQKQRIAIARAILKNPQILILDEATSALDAESERAIQQSLKQLMEGKTVLVIAHRMSTIKEADRIYVLQKGKVIESGTHHELIRRDGVYSTFYNFKL